MSDQQITQQLHVHELDPREFRLSGDARSIGDHHICPEEQRSYKLQKWTGDLYRVIRAVESFFAKFFEARMPRKTASGA